MHDQALIAEVCKRRAIWDNTCRDYGKRNIREALWDEIGEVCQMNPDNARKRWRSLRDSYRQELKKLLKAGSTKWAPFESLDFLRDVMNGLNDPNCTDPTAPQIIMDENTTFNFPQIDIGIEQNTTNANVEMYTNVPTDMEINREHYQENNNITANTTNANVEMYTNVPTEIERTRAHYQENNNVTTTTVNRRYPPKKRKKRKFSEELISFLDLEKEKLNTFKENSELTNDPDYSFLISFLPHMKSMSEINNLRFRAEVSRILMEIRNKEITHAQNSSTPPSEIADKDDAKKQSSEEHVLFTFEVYSSDQENKTEPQSNTEWQPQLKPQCVELKDKESEILDMDS